MNEYRHISFGGAYDAGDFLYASNGLFNGMLKINKQTQKAEYTDRFFGESLLKQGLHHKVYRYKNELVFTPDNAVELHIYDLDCNKMQSYPLNIDTSKKSRCIDSFFDGEKIWLFYAYAEQPIVIFDLRNHTQEVFGGIADVLPQEIKERQTPMLYSKLEKVGRKIYGAVWGSPHIIEFDMDLQKTEIYTLENKETKLTGIAFDGEVFWLTELDCAMVKSWHPHGETENISAPDVLTEAKGLVYCNIVCHDGKVFLIPNCGENIFCVDKENSRLSIFCKFPENMQGFTDVRKTWRRFFNFDIVEDNILRLYPAGATMMVDINVDTAEAQGYSFVLDDSWDDEKYMREIIFSHIDEETAQRYLPEAKEVDLHVYLEYVEKTERDKADMLGDGIGKRIWNYVFGDKRSPE